VISYSVSPQFVERYCRGPWYDSATTILGVITGLLGSLYNVEIKSAFPFYWGPGELSAIALGFWFVLLVFSFLFFLRHRATHIAQNKLYKQTKTLERLMRTLPPEEFLTDFAEINNACNDAARVIFSSAIVEREQIEQAIRVVLDGVVTLAKIFEGKPSGIDYAANIMLYRGVDSLIDDEKKLVAENIMFIENGVDVSALDAVLDLQILLSTTTETDQAVPDKNLRPFFLPIPKELNHLITSVTRYCQVHLWL